MSNNRHDPFKDFLPPIRQETPLAKAQRTLSDLIDFTLALSAICMERGIFDWEQLCKMEVILRDARRKMGSSFSIGDGMKAVQAAFRIEMQGEDKK